MITYCPQNALRAAVAAYSPGLRHGDGPLARLVRDGGLYSVFQPLGDLREGTVYAHEALIRGPQGSPLHTPDTLLEPSRQAELLLACLVFRILAQIPPFFCNLRFPLSGILFLSMLIELFSEALKARAADDDLSGHEVTVRGV